MNKGHKISFIALAFTVSSLTACSGGGPGSQTNNSNGSTGSTTVPTPTWTQGIFESESQFKDYCANPRNGNFPDKAGSELLEKFWLRSWSNNTYLWYDEILDTNPNGTNIVEYYSNLKTFEQTPSGNAKDNFHFSMSTQEWEQLNQSGASLGYGAQFNIIEAKPPRKVIVAYSEPNSPASAVQLIRGAEILEVDGADLVYANDQASIDKINAGLFPSNSIAHNFLIRDLATGMERNITMTPKTVISTPVQNVKTLTTSSGKVGYFQFNSHIATAEAGLKNAISDLAAQNITDLVVDLRYNGGGLLALASQLGYMIAGTEATANRTFEKISFNDKHLTIDPVTGQRLTPMPFINVGIGFSVPENLPLPSLNLDRVFVLTTDATCSASEALINGLRGIDVDVIQIGSTTCGKPYGFYPTDNCGTTYFTVQFKGVNHKGFGEYSDGFQPANSPIVEGELVKGCAVADDLSHALGDENEAMLKAALTYSTNQQCPAPSGVLALKAPSHSDVSNEQGIAIEDKRYLELILQNRIVDQKWLLAQ